MYDIKRTNPVIPGYTGFLPKTFGAGEDIQRDKPHGEIPGYAGFIKAVKAENLFAKTYGKLTYISSAGDHEKGCEIPDDFRYTSMLQDTYVNQRNVNARTVADVVGVVPDKTVYTETGSFKISAQTFNNTVGFGRSAACNDRREQTLGDAINAFFGERIQEKGPHKLGNPIPGYTGVCRRVNADNIFGLTYAEARKTGDRSHSNISDDKLNNFMRQSKMVPPVRK